MASSGYNRGYEDYNRRQEQQRAEANVFGPPRDTRHVRNHCAIIEYPADDNAMRIGSMGETVLSPLQKKAQQAAYAKSIADDRESSARIIAQENTNHHRSIPRKQPTDTAAVIDEVNILSGIGANESDYLTADGKDRKKYQQQMEYASQLQRQQETQELYREDEQRRIDSLRRAPLQQQTTEYRHHAHQQPQYTGPSPVPRRRVATPGGPRGSEASYYDLGGDGSGMLASFGADPHAEASKKREMRFQYAKQLQEQRQQEQQQQYHHQQQSNGSSNNMSSSNATFHRQQQHHEQPYHPSSSSHGNISSNDAEGYDAEHQSTNYHNTSYHHNHKNSNNHNHDSNNNNSYNPATNAEIEQEQKRRQQKQYYDEIARAAAAAPIRRDRLPVQRNSTPKNMRRPPGAADILQGTGTGLQIGGGGGPPSSSANVYTPGGGGGVGGVVSRGKITVLDPDAADSRARRYHQQQEYARQLDSDAAFNPYPEEPTSSYPSGRRSGRGTLRRSGNGASGSSMEPDVNPYSGYGYRRNDNGYAISKDQDIFGHPHITEEEIAARNTAKKRAAQQEYHQQLQEFENNKVRSAANTANLSRLSLYRAQQLQKEQEQKNLAYGATTRYQGESPLTASASRSVSQSQSQSHQDNNHHRPSYGQELEGSRNRNDTPYQDTSEQDMADGDQPYPYEDRRTLSGRGGGAGGSSSGMSRREPDPVDAQMNTHRRQQQKQYHIALENDAKIVPPKPSYTALPRRSNATRELDERDYPYRQHGNVNGSLSTYKGEPISGGQSSTGHPAGGPLSFPSDESNNSSSSRYSHRGLGYSESLHQPGRDAYDGNVRAQIRSRAGPIAGVVNGYGGDNVVNPYSDRSRAAAADYGGSGADYGGGGSDQTMALPSYRSSGQQQGGGGHTPRTNGSGAATGTSTPGSSSSTGPALVYSNKTAATNATTSSASKQYLFGAAGGPSVGVPSSQAQGLAQSQPQSDYSYGGGAASSSFAYGAKGPSYTAYSSTPTSRGPSSSRGFQSTGSGLSSRQPPQGQGLAQDHLNIAANSYSGRSAGASSRARGSSFMLQ